MPLAEATIAAVIATAEAALNETETLVLSDYGKGVLPPIALSTLTNAARLA